MSIIDSEVAVGEILRIYPATLKVFDRFKIDLCCEAGLSLSAAACQHKLDFDQLLKDLNDAVGVPTVVK